MKLLKKVISSIPIVRTIFVRLQEKVRRSRQLKQPEGFPPGHFHSPIPSLLDIKNRENEIWSDFEASLPGIQLNTDKQVSLLKELSEFAEGVPPQSDEMRYHIKNDSYPYGGAVLLGSMIRRLTPKRIIEVGSGNTSSLMLDVNETYFKNSISMTFIEPYPQLFNSLIKADDLNRCRLIDKKLQDVPLTEFGLLEENDILFIDSTHVSKIGSDVNYILFRILPSLKPGVCISFHDICYPFEYPKVWVYQGWFWTEAYLLRAFLQYNSDFEVLFWNDYLSRFHPEFFTMLHHRPELADGTLWIRKIR